RRGRPGPRRREGLAHPEPRLSDRQPARRGLVRPRRTRRGELESHGPGKGPLKVLSGGVSGDVVLTDEGHVRKQFLPRLKVAMEWLSNPARVFREIDSMKAWSRIVGPECVPQIYSVEPASFA